MLTLKAPAKINWFLEVLGKRDDGYHEIESLIQKITLYDMLTLKPSAKVAVTSNSGIPEQENLVYRAAGLLKNKYNVGAGAEINLDKVIPVGAGLGGGSSDAAAALTGLNALWSLDLSVDELAVLAGDLGSDVPLFLYDPLSLVRGRGEVISPCNPMKSLDILVVKPDFGVSTDWVYKNFSMLTKKAEKVNNIEHFIRDIEKAEISGITGVALNDLESVTIKRYPVIAEIKERLIERGAVMSLMSGSGPTVFGVFNTREKAEDASQYFKEYWTAVAQTII